MADITVYRDPAAVNVIVIDGDPPANQAAEVAALTQQLAAMTSQRDQLQAIIDQVRVKAQALKDKDDASVDGADILGIVG